MSGNKPSEAHKATMRRHYAESVAAGVPPDVIHRELQDVVFAEVGKYSMQQITGTTSWIAGEILKGKRVNDIVWNEDAGKTNEDANFDNPDKNASRNWHVEQLLKHTTFEQRQKMNYLLLPGQNEYDFDAFTKAGLQGRNLLTFILGDDPKAVARYLRNGRKHDVQNRRVGDMNELLITEPTHIQGGYVDYFGQYCPEYVENAHLLPLDPNCSSICIGLNVKKGREHGFTKEHGNATRARRAYVDQQKETVSNAHDLMRIHVEAEDVKPQQAFEMVELRDELVYDNMFRFMGVAQQRNWVAPELAKKFAKLHPENADLDDLHVLDQYMRTRESLQALIGAVGMVDQFTDKLKIYTWMTDIAASVSLATFNTPAVRHLARPISYISGESKKPFRSYFGVLETRRTENEKHMKAFEFIYALGHVLAKRVQGVNQGIQKALDVHDLIKVTGTGSQKRITVFESSKPVGEISHERLLEARVALGRSACSVENPDENYEEILQKETRACDLLIERGKDREALQILADAIKQKMGMVRPMTVMSAKRNDPCTCGSGKKYKKCCMRHG